MVEAQIDDASVVAADHTPIPCLLNQRPLHLLLAAGDCLPDASLALPPVIPVALLYFANSVRP